MQAPYGEFSRVWDITGYVDAGSRLPVPAGTPLPLRALVATCWAERTDARPSFARIKTALKDIIANVDEHERTHYETQLDRKEEQQKDEERT